MLPIGRGASQSSFWLGPFDHLLFTLQHILTLPKSWGKGGLNYLNSRPYMLYNYMQLTHSCSLLDEMTARLKGRREMQQSIWATVMAILIKENVTIVYFSGFQTFIRVCSHVSQGRNQVPASEWLYALWSIQMLDIPVAVLSQHWITALTHLQPYTLSMCSIEGQAARDPCMRIFFHLHVCRAEGGCYWTAVTRNWKLN